MLVLFGAERHISLANELPTTDMQVVRNKERKPMAIAASTTRAPRGTKILVQAFFTAADEIPETNRAAVVKAALTAIRGGLKADREKVAAKAKSKTGIKVAPKKLGRPKGSKNKTAKVVRLTTRREGVANQRGGKVAAKRAPKQAPKSMAA